MVNTYELMAYDDEQEFIWEEECAWAREQLKGHSHVSQFEWQMMMLVWFDYACMQQANEGVTYGRWPSDFQPYSWSWLL